MPAASAEAEKIASGSAPEVSSILLVKDEKCSSSTLAWDLQAFGHVLMIADGFRDSFRLIASMNFDAVVIECELPHDRCLSLVRTLRNEGMFAPLLLVSRSARPVEVLDSLHAGADDFLFQPVSVSELVARVRAQIRARSWSRALDDIVSAGPFTISPKRYRVWHNGKPINLRRIEFLIMLELARKADTIVSRSTLRESVWQADVDSKAPSVEIHIHRLRRRLADQCGLDPITTIRGVGYLLQK